MKTPVRALLGAAFAAVLFFVSACTGVPKGIDTVDGFDLQRYLGTWYEVARLDHRFERDLSDVTATYSLREDGGVRVVNRGYNLRKAEWDEAVGKAYFIDDSSRGRLKVSFFGPFYGGYNIVELDKEGYEWSLVVGPNRSYLWILSRNPELATDVLEGLLRRAESLGFAIDELIFPEHTRRASEAAN